MSISNAGNTEGQPERSEWRRVAVLLIHPSNYDHATGGEGIGAFVQTYRYGVIPSNSLRVLESLTEEALRRPPFTGLPTEVHVFEDSVRRQQRAFRKLLRRFPEEGTLLVVGLVGVQSNQFPRAQCLIEEARTRGAICVAGGPHITAGINTALYGISTIDPFRPGVPSPHRMPPEIQQLLDTPGVVVFHGDADCEDSWHGVLVDIFEGKQKNYYEAGLAEDLDEPGNIYTNDQLNDFVTPVAPVDTERGCPYKCKFCAAIQAHGRRMRCRDPHRLVDWVRRQCESHGGKVAVLFASDNLARNPRWRELLSGLKALREEGCNFSLWAEADVLCNSGPNAGFLEQFAAAGGHALFFGIESLDPENLRAAGKKQNMVEDLSEFFRQCRRHGIAPEGGYIVGLPHDTPESIVRSAEQLARMGLARAWFFISTLIPGSQDWAEAHAAGRPISPDLNDYDSTRPVSVHERMSESEWLSAYDGAVRTFYSVRNMIRILVNYPDSKHRWRLIKGFLWCRWAHLTERSHPMIAGFLRCRPWGERRPGQAPISRLAYLRSEAWRYLRYAACGVREFYLFQQVILETEWHLRHGNRPALDSEPHTLAEWLRGTFGGPMRRKWLNEFWILYGRQKWRLLNPLSLGWHLKALLLALSEAVYTFRFLGKFGQGLRRSK